LRVAAIAVVLVGCGPVVSGDGAQESSSSDASATDASTTTPGTTTTATTGTPGTTGTSSTTTDTSGPADTSTSTTSVDEVTTNDDSEYFDVPGLDVECDLWKQDCPKGDKCMPWSNDGSGAWNSTRCSPLDPNPAGLGEPCVVEGSGVSGIDNCDIRAMCFWVDPDTNMGECVPFCEGTPEEPTCADDCSRCTLSAEGVLILCLPECDPLVPSCDEGQGCYPWNDTFGCYEDLSGDAGAPLDPCELVSECDSGSFCAAQEYVPGCMHDACCTPMCDAASPDACEAEVPGAVCTPWFARVTDGECYPSMIGVCATPK
jgi:hypothetical protein